MKNQLFSQKYFISKVLFSDDRINCYVAEKVDNDSNKLFIVNEICDRKIIENCILDFLNLKKASSLYDFEECFSENSKFYVVFSYTQGKSLARVLTAERFAFAYRLSLIKKIIVQFSEYNDLFDMLKVAMLDANNIIFDENSVNFNYRLSAVEFDEGNDVFSAFRKLFKLFFSDKEIEKNSNLKVIDEKCERKIYNSFGMILKDLEKVTESIDKDEKIKLAFEEKKQKAKSLTIKIISVVAICVAIFVIYEQVSNNNEEATVYSDIDHIGNVDIYKSGEMESESATNVYIDDYGYIEYETESESETESETETITSEPVSEIKTEGSSEATVESTTETAKEKTYTVKANDNLTKIVVAEYGSDKYVDYIRKYNNIPNGDIIEVGQSIKLPIIK